jgi:hypothetical protein
MFCKPIIVRLLSGIIETIQMVKGRMLLSPGVDLSSEIRVNMISVNSVK